MPDPFETMTRIATLATCLAALLVTGAGAADAQQTDPPRAQEAGPRQVEPLVSVNPVPDAGGSRPADKDALAQASERYEAAEYEGALALLDEVKSEDTDTPTRVSVEQYRALCLMALGRENDAREAIVQLITLDPTYDVNKLNVSPSAKKRFLDVRAQLLPGMARDEYEAGKAAFARKAYYEATLHLRKAVALSDAALASGADDANTRDTSTLAQGFLDLASANAATTAQRPAGDASASPAPANGNATRNDDASPLAKTPAPPHAPIVTEPVAIRQDIPPISSQLRQLAVTSEGVLELTVDPTGRVTRAVVKRSIYPVYDELLLRAARNWRYRPGTINGKPIPRTVTVSVRPQ